MASCRILFKYLNVVVWQETQIYFKQLQRQSNEQVDFATTHAEILNISDYSKWSWYLFNTEFPINKSVKQNLNIKNQVGKILILYEGL